MRLATVLACTLALATSALASVPTLTPIGVYETGIFDEGATEIAAYDPATARLFSVDGFTGSIDVLDLSDPTSPTFLFTIDVTTWGAGANSVDFRDGVLAAAVEAADAQASGAVVFFDADGTYLNDVEVGALPDMLTFSPDGSRVLVACEGEPNDDYTVDPEGSVAIVDLSGGVAGATVQIAGFAGFNGDLAALQAAGVRIYGPGATVAQDLEPEYIAVSGDGLTAWAICQENNALAVVDVASATVTAILPLGFKDHSLPGNGIDASDRDGVINIQTWPVLGMYQPDAMVSYEVGGMTYLVTANEGDSRDYDGYSEETRVEDLTLDPTAFPDAATLQLEENLGRLGTTTANGDTDGDGDWDVLYANGARSFSIWDAATGALVFDSGEEFEQILAQLLPTEFNSNNDENGSFDSRSDAKGPEPEGVAVTQYDGNWYAIIGLERVGGLLVYDITDPTMPMFIEYVTTRDFSGDAEMGTAGGLGPEGILVIDAEDSPVGQPLVVVSNEVSGSIDVFLFDELTVPVENPVEELPAELPQATRLVGAFPNPFNPVTSVKFSLARDAQVELDVVDVRGRHVQSLVSERRPAGEHSVVWTADSQPSGVYFAVLKTDEVVQVKRMTLVK
jgi:hypothetical protein